MGRCLLRGFVCVNKRKAGNLCGFPAMVEQVLEIVPKGELLFARLDQGGAVNTEAGAAGDYRV
jgi:hypothetical protein